MPICGFDLHQILQISIILIENIYLWFVELAWCSGSVMDCHATARGSIPSGNGVKTKLHVFYKGQ